MHYIFDIDGTLANMNHRMHHIQEGNNDWKKFMDPELVAKDVPYERGIQLCKRLYEQGANILFVTGRNEGLRKVTSEWLNNHLGHKLHESYLQMRPLDDYRVASVYKNGVLKKFLKESKILGSSGLAFDDDDYMTSVYERYGLLHLHAPSCWDTVHILKTDLPEETTLRK